MPEDTPPGSETQPPAAPPTDSAPAKKAAKKVATAKKTTAKKTTATAKKAATTKTATTKTAATKTGATKTAATKSATKKTAATKKTTAKAPAKKTTAKVAATPAAEPDSGSDATSAAPLFQAPDATQAPARRPRQKPPIAPTADEPPAEAEKPEADDGQDPGDGASRRRRRRGGRRRRKPGGENDDAQGTEQETPDDQSPDRGKAGTSKPETTKGDDADESDESGGESPSSRRRRRRRRAGEEGGEAGDDPQNTVTRVRKTRSAEDQITAVSGSTRLEAKKQRRREGREAGRRRAPIVSEAEFLARRESVERVMAIRQRDDLTQIAVLEDKVLVEHYVARESQTSLIGNVYIGRVQNVLPSMEAAFIDIGKGRNAVLYAGEVNWSSLGHKDGQPRKIESVLSSGQAVLVQVTKDPVGHKGARLTSQISLAGRFLVYVPDGTNSGISRKLPDTERGRLKALLKEIVPDGAGVIVRTAAEGAREDELTRDVERLKARWDDIEKKSKGSAPQLLYGEPDLMLKVVRDLFTEDFAKLVVQGSDAWGTVKDYVTHVAPDLEERLEEYDDSNADLFSTYRIDEQIHKGLDRKVWLPSGGSLIIDRTEAMTVVDVNTGKFTGSGGNLEETVTKNNLEAAEEMVRQLRLRDIGGIIVIDFIDMVLESNRDLVLRRLVECLGRDRTRHQVAEVTSLGLVQMTRKRIGTGLLEAFSESCEHCAGRGVVIADAPIEPRKEQESKRGSRRSRGGRGRGDDSGQQGGVQPNAGSPSPKDVAAMARTPKPEAADDQAREEQPHQEQPSQPTEPEPAPKKPASKKATKTAKKTAPKKTAEEPAPVADAAPATEAPEQPEPAPEPVAPKVVTRTRRRSASRPAGPPASSATDPAEPDRSAAAVASVGTVGAPPADGAVEPGTVDAESGSRPVVEHVPVKKRGSRKR